MFRSSSNYSVTETKEVSLVSDKSILCLILLILAPILGWSQKIELKAGFVEEYYEIGQPVHYWMSVRYPLSTEIVLPDSLFNFGNFEYNDKKYYESQLIGDMVLDTVIYKLECYEVDPVQKYKLPAFILSKNGDSTRIFPETDSLLFHHLVNEISDTTQLKADTEFLPIDNQFNVMLMYITIGAVLVIIALVIVFFGKSILKKWKLRKMKKDYTKFAMQLSDGILSIKSQPTVANTSSLYNSCKVYLEQLEKKPYTSMTSKEILKLGYTNEIKEALLNIDRLIYGNKLDPNIFKSFQSIEDFTQNRFSVITDEIKNSK